MSHLPNRLIDALKGVYKRLITFQTYYLSLPTDDNDKADIIYLKHSYEAIDPPGRSRARRIKTMVLNVTLDEQEIYNRFNTTTKYEINRALRDGVTYSASQSPTLDQIGEFLAASRDLVLRKNIYIPPLGFFVDLSGRGELVITQATRNGEPLSYHVYIRKQSVALLINSVTVMHNKNSSADRNFAGRANRLNHWKDITFLRMLGVERLDLGGWAADEKEEQNRELQSIAEFKSGFGAETIYAYYQLIPHSIIGNIVMRVRHLRP